MDEAGTLSLGNRSVGEPYGPLDDRGPCLMPAGLNGYRLTSQEDGTGKAGNLQPSLSFLWTNTSLPAERETRAEGKQGEVVDRCRRLRGTDEHFVRQANNLLLEAVGGQRNAARGGPQKGWPSPQCARVRSGQSCRSVFYAEAVEAY